MNIDERKAAKVQEALGWLKQVEVFHKGLRFELADDCIARAKTALADSCFDRAVIPGYSRSQQPETLWVKNPTTGGKMLINSVDYDPGQHQIWEEPISEKPGTKRNR